MRKKMSYLLVVLLSLSLCWGLLPSEMKAEQENKDLEQSYPLELEDSVGRTVEIAKEPQTVVSLGPNMTELIYALGAGDRLVGRTDYCDYPAEVAEVQSIGSLMEPNLELIAELAPDLVLASTHVSDEVVTKLEELDIPVLMLYDSEHLDGLGDLIDILGQALNLRAAATELKTVVFDRINDVRDASKALEDKLSVYYLVGFGESGEYTAGGNTFINDIIEAAGGQNVAADLEGWSYSLEDLMEADPDLILLPAWAEESFGKDKPYSELTAVKEGRVLVVDDNLFSRQGPRNAEAVELLYDELFRLNAIAHSEASSYPLTITDSLGRDVEIAAQPQRVISLGPNMTELMYALEADDRLVGRTDYCDYPEDAKAIDSVGTLMEPNLELIAELAPDLVIASTHVSEEIIDKLDELKIPVVMFYDEEHLSGLSQIILDLGHILNVNTEAKLLEHNCSSRIQRAARRVERLDAPTLYYVVGFGEYGEFTAGGNTFINDILETGGAKNVAEELEGWNYSLEALIESDPDIILLPAWAADSFGQEAPYSELTAVKNGNIVVVDDNLFSRQGPRNADAVELITKIVMDFQDGQLDEDYQATEEDSEPLKDAA